MENALRTLVIPAAGAGTRLRPITYVYPKELVRLVDKPIAYYLLAEAHLAGISRVIFIIHRDNPTTRTFFESSAARELLADFPTLQLSFIETDTRGGDGQALLLAEETLKGEKAFGVTMGDLVTLPGTSILQELALLYTQTHIPTISVEEVARERTDQYGVIDAETLSEGHYHVRGIVEKPKPDEAPSTLAMTGKYVLTPGIFNDLRTLADNMSGGELKLAHALHRYATRSRLEAFMPQTRHFDTGTKQALLETEVAFSLEHKDLSETAKRLLGK